MCLAIPMRVTTVDDDAVATLEVDGIEQRASLVLVPEARVGDYVLVHAGFAITVLDEVEARERLDLFAEWQDFERGQQSG